MSGAVTTTGRVVALDPGSRRVGVAVSDSGRTMAFPRPALDADDTLLDKLRELIEEEGAVAVVVGLPKSLNGTEGTAAASARLLSVQLAARLVDLDLEVVLHDERLTTVQAAGALSRAGKNTRSQRSSIDSAAAAVLLEAWLACQ